MCRFGGRERGRLQATALTQSSVLAMDAADAAQALPWLQRPTAAHRVRSQRKVCGDRSCSRNCLVKFVTVVLAGVKGSDVDAGTAQRGQTSEKRKRERDDPAAADAAKTSKPESAYPAKSKSAAADAAKGSTDLAVPSSAPLKPARGSPRAAVPPPARSSAAKAVSGVPPSKSRLAAGESVEVRDTAAAAAATPRNLPAELHPTPEAAVRRSGRSAPEMDEVEKATKDTKEAQAERAGKGRKDTESAISAAAGALSPGSTRLRGRPEAAAKGTVLQSRVALLRSASGRPPTLLAGAAARRLSVGTAARSSLSPATAVIEGRSKRLSRSDSGISAGSAGGGKKARLSGSGSAAATAAEDEVWEGFVPDLEAFRPRAGCGAAVFAKSPTLKRIAEAARERLRRDDTLETLEESEATPRALPDARLTPHLHSVLILDWRAVCEAGRPHLLPREPTAAAILAGYAGSTDRLPAGMKSDTRLEFAEGVRDHLDAMARPALLYCEAERDAHDAATAGGARASEVYGLEHLVRLVARLPVLCAALPMTEEDRREAAAAHGDLVRYLDRLAPSVLPAIVDM